MTVTAFADEHVAIIKNMTNDVNVYRSSDASSMDASVGMKLFEYDVIRTGENGTVGLIFRDNTLMTLGENSEMTIRVYQFEPRKKKYGFKMYLKSGSAVYSSGKMAKLAPEAVQIQTPKGTVGVRGTKFLVEVE